MTPEQERQIQEAARPALDAAFRDGAIWMRDRLKGMFAGLADNNRLEAEQARVFRILSEELDRAPLPDATEPNT